MALLGRDTKVTSPLPDGTLLLETFKGKEELGTPYRYKLTLLSENPSIPIGKVLGQPLTVHLALDTGGPRYFSGIVTRFAKAGVSMKHTRYVAVLTPQISLFGYARDCRIFNDVANFGPDPEAKECQQTALEIVRKVLGDRGFTAVDAAKLGSHVYRERRYCVQYRETDLNFVQRLLEEEGIYYYFKHTDGKQTLVLVDPSAAHESVPGYESVLYLPKERKQARDEEHFWSLNVSGNLHPGLYTVLRGYDYTKVRAGEAQTEEEPSGEPLPGAEFEDCDFPGGLSKEADAEAEATVRKEADQVANTVIEVEGNTMGLGVGDLVTLRKPPSLEGAYNPFWNDADFAKKYVIISATYSISINQYETGDVAGSDEPFKATYRLLDSNVNFRPTRTATKPRIEGPQTAIVVGSAGDEEICTDKYGRVKVQFDWDRKGGRDEKSGCWIRVAQVWAGKQWGAMHIPRVGQEVIVEFLDGDPDRPIITGRVYNKDNMPPYDLPKNKTQGGIKSRSSKGGTDQNFNEIRFEDLKGKEELHIQAERDMSTLVKANHTVTVGGNSTVTVKGGDGSADFQSVHTVTGKHNLHTFDSIKVDAPNKIEIVCSGSSIVLEPGKITLTAGDHATVVLDANVFAKANGKGSLLLDSNVLAASADAGSKLLLDGTVQADAKGGGKLKLDASVQADSSGGSQLKLDGDAKLHGAGKATVEGSSEATLTAGGTVKTSSEGVEATGNNIKLNG